MQSSSRLYEQFQPEHYIITFDLTDNDRQHVFYTRTIITGKKLSGASLRLHAQGLDVLEIEVNGEKTRKYHLENNELVIETQHVGYVTVAIETRGDATDAMHGIYPCYYELNGEKKELIATQFESHHAREAFPCVDEPEAKATFGIILLTQPHLRALSNMPQTQCISLANGMWETSFQTTPRMSPYLLAFVVGDLQKRTTKTWGGVEVNVYATKAQPANSLKYAADWAKRSVEFFEDYFDIKYPLPKCDHVALPDFSASAMENWGLITYREAALLVDPKHATAPTKQHVSTVISHEVAHQWFGNLVTMKWWDDLWLNESFANLMEYIACDALEPNWHIWDEFSVNECFVALRRDALDGVQPVKVEVNEPGEIEALFDHAIVYAKGSRLLRMLHDYIGDDAFRQGLKHYFKQNSYGNTTENDLWNSLSAISGKDIANFMSTWLVQPGYPVVTFDENSLSQQRFFIGDHKPDPTYWQVPLLASKTTFPKLLSAQSLSVENKIVMLNMLDGAHFLTRYNDEQLQSIKNALEHAKIDSVDAVKMLNEQLLLALGGLSDASQLLSHLAAIAKYSSPSVWAAAQNVFFYLKFLVENDTVGGPLLRSFAQKLTTEQHARLGWKQQQKESEDNTRLRPIILSIMGYSATEDVVKYARAAHNSVNFADMNPTTRVPIFRILIHEGIDDLEFKELIELYKTSTSPELQLDLMSVMASTRAPEQINMIMPLLSNGAIKPQDLRRWLPLLLASPYARSKTWEWMRDQWDWIASIFQGDLAFDSFPMFAGRYLTTRDQLREFREFFKPWADDPALKRAIALGAKELEANVAFIQHNQQALIDYLQNFNEVEL